MPPGQVRLEYRGGDLPLERLDLGPSSPILQAGAVATPPPAPSMRDSILGSSSGVSRHRGRASGVAVHLGPCTPQSPRAAARGGFRSRRRVLSSNAPERTGPRRRGEACVASGPRTLEAADDPARLPKDCRTLTVRTPRHASCDNRLNGARAHHQTARLCRSDCSAIDDEALERAEQATGSSRRTR